MFIIALLALLSERGYHISECTQALIDALSLLDSLFISPIGEADIKSFATSQINQV